MFLLNKRQDDKKLLIQAASSGSSGDPKLFYELFRTPSWETLMTFTRENARTYYFFFYLEKRMLMIFNEQRVKHLFKKAWTRRWTICRKTSATRSPQWRPSPLALPPPLVHKISAYARIVRLRTRVVGQTVKCVVFH